MIVAAIRDESPDISKDITEPEGSEQEQAMVKILEHVWFSALVGWAVGSIPPRRSRIRCGRQRRTSWAVLPTPGAVRRGE